MKRPDLEHILRAAGSISGCGDMVVIGSQAILASFPDAPESLLVSMEADVYPRDEPEKADLIDGSIGELSPFHSAFGYYAHGVGPETAILPKEWRTRLVKLETSDTGGCTGWCLSPLDLAIGKLLAGRDKDFAFVQTMLHHKMVKPSALEALIQEVPEPNAEILRGRLSRCFA
jgi:hypothetical protein